MSLPDAATLERVAAAAGRVAVYMGGAAAEREVSLRSGAAVVAALRAAGVEAEPFDWDGSLAQAAPPARFDRVFIAVHGRGGEDGQLQALLELGGIPYTGSGVLGCALAMDKRRAKLAWLGAGLPTPPFVVVEPGMSAAEVVDSVGLPLFVKPAREGSSLGISRAASGDEVGAAVDAARAFDDAVIAERCIEGGEYTVGIIGDEVLPAIKVETPRAFYDFAAKYDEDDTRYLCPCGLDASAESALHALAARAFETLDGRGWGRVDFMRDADGKNWLIELNTVPGMTDHSLVPMAAAAAGLSFEQLVLAILAASMDREIGS
ncbi:MAG: D-alanine--D-alanine ligase [Gammaproteobacteria bacterium]